MKKYIATYERTLNLLYVGFKDDKWDYQIRYDLNCHQMYKGIWNRLRVDVQLYSVNLIVKLYAIDKVL